jgi:tetratricopeptide (TPR) repeat protein
MSPCRSDSEFAILDILRATFDAWSRLPEEREAPPFPALDPLGALWKFPFPTPLVFEIAAIGACEKGNPAILTTWKGEDLLDYAVVRERCYVEDCFGLGSERALLAERGVALLTFLGPMAKDDPKWLNLLESDAKRYGCRRIPPSRVSEDVAALLGEGEEDHALKITPLGPDLLAEAFAVEVLRNSPVSLDPEIEATLECAGHTAWISLLRAAVDLYKLGKFGVIDFWLQSLIARLARPELYLVEALMSKHSLWFNHTAAAVSEAQLRALPPGEQEDQERVRIIDRLAELYEALKSSDEARGLEQQAVEIYERLANQNPGAFEPGLATSLRALASNYKYRESLQEALELEQRAVEIRERLAKQNPEAFEPDLADSLDTLADLYCKLNRTQEALQPAQRAVEIGQGLTKQHPDDVIDLGLADSLARLSEIYADLGMQEEAQEVGYRAGEIYDRAEGIEEEEEGEDGHEDG